MSISPWSSTEPRLIDILQQWIVMIIVIALGLSILGFGGRWLKKRYDRKHDQTRTGFNAGITSRSAEVSDEKVVPSSSGAAAFEAGSMTGSPARTREAFMPYGYGYKRSESRNGTGEEGTLTRGGTPFEELEKGEAAGESVGEDTGDQGVKGKMRRVLVSERSIR